VSIYTTTVNQVGLSEAHRKMLALVPRGAVVLEVGCASGYFTRALVANGASAIDGIEMNPEDARQAAPACRYLIVDSVENDDVLEQFEDEFYDAIVCGDVLEHLRDPDAVLQRLVPKLRRGGVFVISIPNVAHHSVRFGLLFGRFEYEDLGILDRTHFRFFTRTSLRQMIERAGLVLEREEYTYGRGKSLLWRIELLAPLFHRTVRPLIPLLPGLLAFQFVVAARLPDSATQSTR
jgi:2-polyprenyl-3-methyl-5-hydroxy-6-metoxy-1,4-benzoquinol methylase